MNLRKAFAGFFSVLSAAAVPALAFTLWMAVPDRMQGALPLFMMTFFVTFGHALILGLPAATVLAANEAFRPFSMLAAGFLVGFLPAALFFATTSRQDDWRTGIWAATITAILGAMGGLAFYFTHRLLYRDNQHDSHHGPGGSASFSE